MSVVFLLHSTANIVALMKYNYWLRDILVSACSLTGGHAGLAVVLCVLTSCVRVVSF